MPVMYQSPNDTPPLPCTNPLFNMKLSLSFLKVSLQPPSGQPFMSLSFTRVLPHFALRSKQSQTLQFRFSTFTDNNANCLLNLPQFLFLRSILKSNQEEVFRTCPFVFGPFPKNLPLSELTLHAHLYPGISDSRYLILH